MYIPFINQLGFIISPVVTNHPRQDLLAGMSFENQYLCSSNWRVALIGVPGSTGGEEKTKNNAANLGRLEVFLLFFFHGSVFLGKFLGELGGFWGWRWWRS